MLDVIGAVAVVAIITAIAVPQLLVGPDEYRTRGAVRYVVARLQQARVEAVMRSANAAMLFRPLGSSYTFATYIDGNRNGVLSRDILAGIDRQVGATDGLSLQFSGVDFGLLSGVVSADGTPLDGTDPFRFGSGDMVSFTPEGTATSGSLYIKGGRGAQYVVRVYGDTGKAQALRFDPRRGVWLTL